MTTRLGSVVLVVALFLAAGAGAAWFAQAAWESVVRYRTPYRFAEGRHLPRPGPGDRLFLITIDGLRQDISRELPFLSELRAAGADYEIQAGTPSYSRPGRATLATGTWPEIHGVSTNRYKGTLDADNIIRAAARSGRSCRIAGSKIWPALFERDIARCGAYRSLEENEVPGQFRSFAPTLEAEEGAGVAFVLAESADLTILDFTATDAAAHDRGVFSDEYLRQARRIDGIIRSVVQSVGLGNATFVVTADHGHLDRGGHGAAEAEVLRVPLVMAGPGVRAGVAGTARQIDVAPTVAALLGVPIPGAASGRVLVEALALPGDLPMLAHNASRGQQRAFAEAYAGAVGTGTAGLDPDPEAAIAAVRTHLVSHEQRRRLPASAGLGIVALALLTFGLGGGASTRRAVLAGAAACAVAWGIVVLAARQPLTLSAINYDEQVGAFFRPFILYGFVAFLAGSTVALWAGRQAPGSRFALVLRLAAVLGGAAVAIAGWAYGLGGLFSQQRLASVTTLFAVFVVALQVVGWCAAALAVGAVLALANRWRGNPPAQMPSPQRSLLL